MILTYRYRLLPTKRQHAALAAICESQRQLYNAALEERIGCYRATGTSRSYVDQTKALTTCRRDIPDMGALPVMLQRWTLKRLDDAYASFFRRVKERTGAPGFPRFRSKGRWRTFGFNEMDGLRFDGKRLRFKGMPSGLRVHLHRDLPPNADVRSCSFRRDEGGWTVCLAVRVDTPERRAADKAIGIDLGLSVFAYCSDGIVVPNPRIARAAEQKFRVHQRALARCKRGSNRRRKAKVRLARLHARIANTRSTWLHQQSSALVKRADLIVAEDLAVKNMVRHPILARSISDASWSKFLDLLAYKAEKAGAQFIRVNPRNTSKKCSGCNELVPKSLAVRTHSCPHCGLVIDRDWNASLNILQAGIGLGALNVVHQDERAPGNTRSRPTGQSQKSPLAEKDTP